MLSTFEGLPGGKRPFPMRKPAVLFCACGPRRRPQLNRILTTKLHCTFNFSPSRALIQARPALALTHTRAHLGHQRASRPWNLPWNLPLFSPSPHALHTQSSVEFHSPPSPGPMLHSLHSPVYGPLSPTIQPQYLIMYSV